MTCLCSLLVASECVEGDAGRRARGEGRGEMVFWGFWSLTSVFEFEGGGGGGVTLALWILASTPQRTLAGAQGYRSMPMGRSSLCWSGSLRSKHAYVSLVRAWIGE